MAHVACTLEPNWLACNPRNLGYTGKQGRSSEHLGTCFMGQMACPLEPRQIQQGTSILGKPGSPSELVLWPMWPMPRNPTGLPELFEIKHLGTCPMAHVACTSEPRLCRLHLGTLLVGPVLCLRYHLGTCFMAQMAYTSELGLHRLYLGTHLACPELMFLAVFA